jgi:hypothetical protein
MKLIGGIVLISMCLIAVSVMAGATDYKTWMPLLPETIGGMGRSGKPDGVNMETSGQAWSALHQRYESEGSERYVELNLFGGDAPQMAGFQTITTMKIETEDQIIKPVQVKKYKASLNFEKNGKRGTLIISLGEKMMAVLEAGPITQESELMKLAEELPLDKFAALAE